MSQKFTNNATATIQADILFSDTSLTIGNDTADKFPVANTTSWGAPIDWFKATITDSAENVEIIKVGIRSAGSAVFTNIIRAQEGTTARNFLAGSVIQLMITAEDITNLQQLEVNLLNKTSLTLGPALVGFDATFAYPKDTIGGNAIGFYVDAAAYPWLVKADGVTNNDVALTNVIAYALTKANGRGIGILLPPGNIRVSTLFTVPGAVNFISAGRESARVLQDNLSSGIFLFTGNYSGLQSMSLLYAAGTPLIGATAIKSTGTHTSLSNFSVLKSHTAVNFENGGSSSKVTNFDLFDYESCGILMNNSNDVFVNTFTINAGSATKGVVGGIRLVNKAEAFICSDGDILNGVFSITTDATTNTLGTRPAYNKFSNIFFDSGAQGSSISKMVETDFVGCWFSGGRTGVGFRGLALVDTQSLRFTNTDFFNCGGSGLVVDSTNKNVTLENCSANSNSVTTGIGVSSGVVFGINTMDFSVIGGSYGNGLYTGQQAYGISVGANCDRFTITGANVVGNATGGILDGSSATAEKSIYANPGCKTVAKGSAIILSGTTSITVTHGLAATPNQFEISLTMGSGPAGSTGIFTGSINATTFTINTATAPAANITVTWEARIKGA
jgi:hypothetical protein